MLKRKLIKQLDRRDELILSLIAGFIPLLSIAMMAHQ